MIKTFNIRDSFKQLKETVLLFALLFFAFALSVFAGAKDAVADGIKLWAACVLPALFPYFFITAAISSLSVTPLYARALTPLTKLVFNTGGITGYLFFISLLSGNPAGAKAVSDAFSNRLISQTEAERASAFCSCSSPIFLLSVVGNIMANSPLFGCLLLCCQTISVLLVGFVFSFYKRKKPPTVLPNATITPFLDASTALPDNARAQKEIDSSYQTQADSDADHSSKKFSSITPREAESLLSDGILGAVKAVLLVGGIITLFYAVSETLFALNVLSPAVGLFGIIFGDQTMGKGIVAGIIELTGGLKIITSLGVGGFALPIAAALNGFGGISVICQCTAFYKKAKIKTAPFIFSRAVSLVFNFTIGLVLSAIFL